MHHWIIRREIGHVLRTKRSGDGQIFALFPVVECHWDELAPCDRIVSRCLMGLGGSSRGAGVGLVDALLGGKESGSDDLAVDHLGTLGLGKHQPHNGEGLDGVVPRNVVEDDAGEGLEEGEHAENDPVGEPLDVILGLRALESLEREVGRDEEADQVGEETSGTVGSRGDAEMRRRRQKRIRMRFGGRLQ